MKRPSQFRDPQLDTSGDIIGFYPREFYVFDNFSSFQVEWRGKLYPTAEHAYQAAHFFDTDPQLAEKIRTEVRSAHDAQKIARQYTGKYPENWDKIKVSVMEDICAHKLGQHEYIQWKLQDSGDLEIVEDSTKDAFWGWGPQRDGRNELGKIWMRLREKHQPESNETV